MASRNPTGERHRPAVHFLGRASEAQCVLTLQTLGEFFHVGTRKGRTAPRDATALIETCRLCLRSRLPIRTALDAALSLVIEHGLAFWDALLWATLQCAGCAVLLSEDCQNGRTPGAVTFLNPFLRENEERLAAPLTPA